MLHSELVGDYRIFQIRQHTSQSPRTGAEHQFYVLNTADWINVVPVTREGKVVLIQQYRHGTEEVMLEIQGGMVDPEDGTPEDSAARELLEETGYAAAELVQIGSVTPNPAMLNNRCHTFLARNVRRVAPVQLEGSEDIETLLVDLETIPELITSGKISHALVIAAFYHYDQYRRANGSAI